MALFTQSEFSDKCQMPSRTMAVYISRKKVIKDENDLINDKDPINSAFIRKREILLQKKPKNNKTEPKSIKSIESGNKTTETKQNPQLKIDLSNEININSLTFFDEVARRKELLQLEELEKINRKHDIAYDKVKGNFIKIEHAKLLVFQLSESLHLCWENEFDDFILKISKRFGFSREQTMELKNEKPILSNIARESAIKTAIAAIRQMSKETSDKRGVGEHG